MSSQTWLHPKSLCLLTILFCAVLVTADGGDQHFEDRIYTLTRTVKQQLNALADMEKVQPQSNSFEPPQEDHTAQDNYINKRLKKIEQIIAEVKNSNSTDVKNRMSDLEAELESMQRSLDGRQKENAMTLERLEGSLMNATSIITDLTRRLMKLEEPERLAELKVHLEKRDLVNAALSANAIIDEMKFLDVVRKQFTAEPMDHKDVDFLLLFGENVSNLKFRFLIYDFIKDKLMVEVFYLKEEEMARYLYLNACNTLKLYHKLDTKLISVPHSSSDLHFKAKKFADETKTFLMTTVFPNRLEELIKKIFLITHPKPLSNRTILNNSALIFEIHDTDSKILEYGFKMVENLNCWLSLNINLINRHVIARILKFENAYYGIGNLRPMNSVQSALYSALKNKNYKDAVAKYESIRDDGRSIDTVIFNVYNELHDIDSLLAFISLIQIEDSRRKLYLAVYDAIDQTELMNVCDLLKLYDRLPDGELKSDLKSSIHSLFEPSGNITQIMNVLHTEFNQITIYSKFDNTILADYEVYTVNRGNNTYCYFKGGVSLSNYDTWYSRFLNKFGYVPFAWPMFVLGITRVCLYYMPG